MPATPPVPPSLAIATLFLGLGILSAILAAWAWALITWREGSPLLPLAARRVVPWGSISVFAVFMAYLALLSLVGMGYEVVQFLRTGRRHGTPPLLDMLLMDALAKVALVALTPLLLRLTSGARLADLGLTAGGLGKNVLLGLWFCFLMLPPVYGVAFAASRFSETQRHPIEEAIRGAIRDGRIPATAAATALAAVVAAPVAEELLFRGVLLGWFWKVGRRRPGVVTAPDGPDPAPDPIGAEIDPFAAGTGFDPPPPRVEEMPPDPFLGRGRHDLAANVFASIIFAGLHAAQWPAPVPLFVLSMALGELYRRTGSLAAPIALHATFNGLSTIAMFLTAAVDV